MSTPSPASPQERPFDPSSVGPAASGEPAPPPINEEPPPLPVDEEPPPLPAAHGHHVSDRSPFLKMVDEYASSVVDDDTAPPLPPPTHVAHVRHEHAPVVAPTFVDDSAPPLPPPTHAAHVRHEPAPVIADESPALPEPEPVRYKVARAPGAGGPPHAHLSITAFIALLFIPFAFLPGIGIIAAALIFALATAVLNATWGGPIYAFSRMLASVCRVLALLVIIVQSVYILFMIYMFFESYREFMDKVQQALQAQQDGLNFMKEVWHYFTDKH